MSFIYGEYTKDIALILSKQFDNGSDFWTSSDGATGLGGPFSTLEACYLLADLGFDFSSKEMLGAVNAVFANQKEDGRIRTFSTGTIYPCQTANAARLLCRLGYSRDARLTKTYEYFLLLQHSDGGWRCNASKYGKGPETHKSNPGPTLTVLDTFRYTDFVNVEKKLEKAVEFLLCHWESRIPIGPCHFGIGTLFMKVEFPVFRYNLLSYVHTLSFYKAAKTDKRFLDALNTLRSKLVDNKIVIESTHKKLRELESCKLNCASEVATRYYSTIVQNMET